ncbi:hypothetical protein ACWGTI_07595 [Mesorhizobium sp. ArgA1]
MPHQFRAQPNRVAPVSPDDDRPDASCKSGGMAVSQTGLYLACREFQEGCYEGACLVGMTIRDAEAMADRLNSRVVKRRQKRTAKPDPG